MRGPFMELTYSVLGSSEINGAFHLSLKNTIFCNRVDVFTVPLLRKVIPCSKVRIRLKFNVKKGRSGILKEDIQEFIIAFNVYSSQIKI